MSSHSRLLYGQQLSRGKDEALLVTSSHERTQNQKHKDTSDLISWSLVTLGDPDTRTAGEKEHLTLGAIIKNHREIASGVWVPC